MKLFGPANIVSSETLILENIVLTHGNANQVGGAIHFTSSVGNPDNLFVSNCIVENNHAVTSGAGIYISYECNADIIDSVISNNQGGGIHSSYNTNAVVT